MNRRNLIFDGSRLSDVRFGAPFISENISRDNSVVLIEGNNRDDRKGSAPKNRRLRVWLNTSFVGAVPLNSARTAHTRTGDRSRKFTISEEPAWVNSLSVIALERVAAEIDRINENEASSPPGYKYVVAGLRRVTDFTGIPPNRGGVPRAIHE